MIAGQADRRRVPIVLHVDVEPDEGELPRRTREPWRGFERLLGITPSLRARLEDATKAPVHLTWALRIDRQVAEAYGSITWALEAYQRDFEALRHQGDALAIHPHAWRWDDRRSRWIQDHADAGWTEHVLRESFAAFEGALGRCEVHKFGSRYISAPIVRVLRELGVAYDLTVEPGAPGRASLGPEATTGSLPDERDAPRYPYRPDPCDPLRPFEDGVTDTPGSDGPWMIPHTSFDPDPLLPAWRRVARRIRHPMGSRLRPAWLPSPLEPAGFWRSIEGHLAELPFPFLSLGVRSDAPLRPYWRDVQAKLDALFEDPLLPRLVFETPAELVARMRGVTLARNDRADRGG